MLIFIFSCKLIYGCIFVCYVFVVDVFLKFVGLVNKDDVSSSIFSLVIYKYLQVVFVVDENVVVKYGNYIVDFLLVLVNIVSSVFIVVSLFFVCYSLFF